MQNNLLKTLELDQIRNLTRLTSLNIEFNRIRELPEAIKEFTSIKKLWIGFNVIKALPHELGALPNLEMLNYENNKLERPPADILIQGSPVTIEYLRRLYAARETFKLDLSRYKSTCCTRT
jgi:Leucine-rich repeat (LRR) protein